MGNEIALPTSVKINPEHWKAIDFTKNRDPSNWALIPEAELKALQVELSALPGAARMEQAVTTAEILLGSYPSHKIEDAKVYSRAIVSVLTKFPASVGAKAVDDMTLRLRFLPTRAEVFAACEAVQKEVDRASYIVGQMLQEHDRRNAEQAEADRREIDRQEFRKKHGNKSPLEVLQADGFTKGNTTRKENAK